VQIGYTLPRDDRHAGRTGSPRFTAKRRASNGWRRAPRRGGNIKRLQVRALPGAHTPCTYWLASVRRAAECSAGTHRICTDAGVRQSMTVRVEPRATQCRMLAGPT
jgi:hypothetical protein